MSKSLDTSLSIELAAKIKSKAKKSFENAYKAALATQGSIYVQGFLASAGKPPKPIEHAWLELEDKIVDPSWPHLNKNAEDVYYYAAQRFTVRQLKAAVEEAKEDYPDDEALPVYGEAPYEYYGDLMLGGQEYLDVYNEAQAKCRELNKPKKPEAD